MSRVKRVYVEKKKAYAVKAKELLEEIGSYLGIKTVTGVRESAMILRIFQKKSIKEHVIPFFQNLL